jgi:hypothetical protein
MKRRRVLAALAAGTAASLLAGCEAVREESPAKSATVTPAPVPDLTRTPSRTRTAHRADDPSANLAEPLGFVIRSRLNEPRSARIRVFDGEQLVYDEAIELRVGDVVRRGTVLRQRGRYRVSVEHSGAGEGAAFDWRVEEHYGDLKVTLTGDGIETVQGVACTPACAPLDQSGEAATLPYAGDSTPLLGTAWIDIENPTAKERTARIRVVDGDRTVLDYTYTVPPGLRPSIPAVRSADTYNVSVQSGTVSREYDWLVPQQPRLRIRLGPVPRIDCGEAVGTVTVQNQDRKPHAVSIAVEREGRELYAQTVELYSGETVALPDVVEVSGRYRIRAESDTGAVTTRDWWVCAGSARAAVDVEVTGIVTIDTVFRY